MFYGNQHTSNVTGKIKNFIVKWVKRIIYISLTIGIIFGIAKAYQIMYPKTVYVTQEVDVTDQKFAEKIDSLEKSVVESVHQCEKRNYNESDGLVTFDPTDAQYAKVQGKRMYVTTTELSYGTYQFKLDTVIYYYKTLYNQSVTRKEAILIALDDVKSQKLTQDVLFKTKDGYKNWLKCANSLNLDDMINAIKKIK